MTFVVNRTSFSEEAKPCDEAKLIPLIQKESISVFGFEKFFSAEEKANWYNDPKSSNHHLDGDVLRRDFEKDTWTVEINTLEDLIAFVDKYDETIIGEWYRNPEYKMLEIYDDYRE